VFVNLIHFPPIKPGKEAAFLEWFDESNRRFSVFPGFIRRVLLRSLKTGAYIGLVEYDSKETFMAMHHSPAQAELRALARAIFEGDPDPTFHETVRGTEQ